MNRHTESIKHKSLILLYDLFSFGSSEIHLIFMHSLLMGVVQLNSVFGALVCAHCVGIADSTNMPQAALLPGVPQPSHNYSTDDVSHSMGRVCVS